MIFHGIYASSFVRTRLCKLNFIDIVEACTESGATVASPTATRRKHRASVTSRIAYFVTEASPEGCIVSGSPFYVFGSETGTVGACGANYRAYLPVYYPQDVTQILCARHVRQVTTGVGVCDRAAKARAEMVPE